MKLLSVFLSGLLFSFGLIVSGMINPEKVLGFLDVFGAWDASLAFVMCGAVIVTTIGYRLVWRRATPLYAASFSLPSRADIDAQLLVGPALFGIGWGLVGLCPGPAFAALTTSVNAAVVFVAMLLGMALARTPWGSTRLLSGAAAAGSQTHDNA